MDLSLFPFHEYWWFYLGFSLFVMALLALDLGVFHRHAHRVSFREAAIWSVVWVTLALLFNYALYVYAQHRFADVERLTSVPGFDPEAQARTVGLQFLAGYLVEKALSVDNIFVFVLVFNYFRIPLEYQHRVLFFGILGAFVFRAIFIALGSILMQYQWIVVFFGVLLIATGAKMAFASEKQIHPDSNPVIRLLRRTFPVTHDMHGQKFFVRLNGVIHITPLLIALVFLEMTDVIFAIDSVPAIFALTDEPLLVFTSNIFAILGLRAMYFLLAGAVDRFYALKWGLALILVFVGLKMVILNRLWGGHFPIGLSLGIIAGVLAISVAWSLIFPKPEDSPVPTDV